MIQIDKIAGIFFFYIYSVRLTIMSLLGILNYGLGYHTFPLNETGFKAIRILNIIVTNYEQISTEKKKKKIGFDCDPLGPKKHRNIILFFSQKTNYNTMR